MGKCPERRKIMKNENLKMNLVCTTSHVKMFYTMLLV